MRLWVPASKTHIDRGPLPFLVITSVLIAVIATSCAAVALTATNSVEVIAWDRQVTLRTRVKTVRDALTQAGIALGEGDACVPAPDAPLEENATITVLRAEPVFITHAGKLTALMTCERSIAAVLSRAGVAPGPEDIVTPAIGENVPASNLVTVVDVSYAEVVESRETPFPTERREDPSLEAGLVQLFKRGMPGEARITYRVRCENGVEVSREETGREELAVPSPQILRVGTLREISRGSDVIRFQRAMEVLCTAYCPCIKCCGPNATGITHLGVPAKKGVVAVDPRVIPLGSRVYVDGYGFALAADTGGAIKGNKIDVCFDSHQEALVWGMRRVKIYILE